MKILVLSDSLTLPRNNGVEQQLSLEETWPRLLESLGNDVVVTSVGIGSATSEDILYQTQYWTGFSVDAVIVQVGLCDALPRALHRWEVEFVKRIPNAFLKKLIKSSASKLRKLRNITLTKPLDFSSNIEKIRHVFPDALFLSIVDSGDSPSHMPGATENVDRFNCFLRTASKDSFVDLGSLDKKSFMPDHYHLTPFGHRQVANKVKDILNI